MSATQTVNHFQRRRHRLAGASSLDFSPCFSRISSCAPASAPRSSRIHANRGYTARDLLSTHLLARNIQSFIICAPPSIFYSTSEVDFCFHVFPRAPHKYVLKCIVFIWYSVYYSILIEHLYRFYTRRGVENTRSRVRRTFRANTARLRRDVYTEFPNRRTAAHAQQ